MLLQKESLSFPSGFKTGVYEVSLLNGVLSLAPLRLLYNGLGKELAKGPSFYTQHTRVCVNLCVCAGWGWGSWWLLFQII